MGGCSRLPPNPTVIIMGYYAETSPSSGPLFDLGRTVANEGVILLITRHGIILSISLHDITPVTGAT